MSKLRCCQMGANIGYCEHTFASARLAKYRADLAVRARRSKMLRTIQQAGTVEELRGALLAYIVARKL